MWQLASGLAIVLSVFVAVSSSAEAKKVLRVGNDGEPQSMDPHYISTVQTSRISDDMFLGLLTHGPDGQPIPGAAESWTSSEDGLTYTFNIRKHNWSDGHPVTAQDFIAGWERLLNPETGAEYASLLYIIDGAREVNSGVQGATINAQALDDQTLRVTLSAPAPYFLSLLTHQTAMPIPRHAVAQHGRDWVKSENIVVNGPYKFVQWSPNVLTKLVKNALFYDADNVAIDEVIYYSHDQLTTMQNRFRAGELDIARQIPSEQISWLEANLPDELRIVPYAGIYYYVLRSDQEPFKDARVRRALSMAINREAIVGSVLKTGEIAAYSFVPPGTGNYGTPSYVSWKDLPYEDKLNQAKNLMKEAGYGPDNRLKFVLRYNTSENHKRIAVAIQNMWKQIGADAELFNTDGKIHYADLKVGDFQIARAGWIADYNDAQNFLYLIETRTGPLNYSKFNNAEFDRLLLEAESITDLKERANVLQRAEAIVMEGQPVIPIYYYVSKQLISKKVVGWIDNAPDKHLTRWLDLR